MPLGAFNGERTVPPRPDTSPPANPVGATTANGNRPPIAPSPQPETHNAPQTPEQEAEGKLHELARRALTPIGEYAGNNNRQAQATREGVWDTVITVMGFPEGPDGSRFVDKGLRVTANALIFVLSTAGDKIAADQIEKLEHLITGGGGPGIINTIRGFVGAGAHYVLEHAADKAVGVAPAKASEFATGRPYPRETAELIAAVANAFPAAREFVNPTNVEAGIRLLGEIPLAGAIINYAYQHSNEAVAVMNEHNVVNTRNVGMFARALGAIYKRARGGP